jgi:sulfatase modifying factor 1
MKKTLILIFAFLVGCTDFISIFYEIDPKETIQVDQNLSQQSEIDQAAISNKDMNTNHPTVPKEDMFGQIPGGTVGGSIPGGSVGGSIPGGSVGGSISGGSVGGMIDESMIRSCRSYLIIKTNDQQIEFEGCTDWASDFEIFKASGHMPTINRGSFTLKDSTRQCLLTINFQSLACGTDQVYEVDALLNLTNCMLVPDLYRSSYTIDRDQGLIINFSEIQVETIDSSVSDSLFFTRLSGHLGSTRALPLRNEANHTISNHMFIYASNFALQSTDSWQTTNIMSECHQNNALTYDSDGDGEASEYYVPSREDCNDRDRTVNSRNPERCYPCRSDCPKMIAIQAGSFQMGTDSSETGSTASENHEHLVSINRDFYVSEHEVTVGEYRICVQSGNCLTPIDSITSQSCNWTPMAHQKENHPMNCINWQEARTYANWAGGDLLSETQWEYVATAQGIEQIYPWGNALPTCDLANHMANIAGNYAFCINPPNGGTLPVCSLREGNTAQGVCDMAGNVWEWVLDEWHDLYLMSAPNNEQAWCSDERCNQIPGAVRVHRGGGWNSDASYLRSSARAGMSSDVRDQRIGFRIARNTR